MKDEQVENRLVTCRNVDVDGCQELITTPLDCAYNAGVAGSNPAPPTTGNARF